MSEGKNDAEKPYKYRLTIETVDCGEKRFEEYGTFNSQGRMANAIPHAIARGIAACFNDPPESAAVMAAMDERGVTHGFGIALSRYWDGEQNIEDAVSISVDIDKLMETAETGVKDMAAMILTQHGINVIRSGSS